MSSYSSSSSSGINISRFRSLFLSFCLGSSPFHFGVAQQHQPPPPPPSFCRRLTAGRLAGDGLIGRRGLVLPKKFGLAVPDRTKQARSTLQLWELKESGGVQSERARASRRRRRRRTGALAYTAGTRPPFIPPSFAGARSLARAPFQRSLTSVLAADGRRTNERTKLTTERL